MGYTRDLLCNNLYAEKKLLTENIDFTMNNITNLLIRMGLISCYQRGKEEKLERYVFLEGDQQEIFVREERRFIEEAGNVYIYQEEYRKTKRENIPCRVIAKELNTIDPLEDSIFLMKVVNKAISGFNIFFIKTQIGCFIGCRLFDKDSSKDCILSDPMISEEDLEEMIERLMYCYSGDEFIPYYSSLVEAIEQRDVQEETYESIVIEKRGVQFSYIETLAQVGDMYHISFIDEINRYYNSFEEKKKQIYAEAINDAEYNLKFIKSMKVNTLEMLFEAEEMMLLANTNEEDNERVISSNINTFDNAYEEDEIKSYLDNPEMLIKLIKQKKGL